MELLDEPLIEEHHEIPTTIAERTRRGNGMASAREEIVADESDRWREEVAL